MSRSLNKFSFISILLLLPLFQGCTEMGSFNSSRPGLFEDKKPTNDIISPVKEVRGPTGGGIGGGIRVVDNEGNPVKYKKVEIYVRSIESFGIKQKIKDGYTDMNGEINLDSDTFEKIADSEATLIVEFYDGTEKTVANAEIIEESEYL